MPAAVSSVDSLIEEYHPCRPQDSAGLTVKHQPALPFTISGFGILKIQHSDFDSFREKRVFLDL